MRVIDAGSLADLLDVMPTHTSIQEPDLEDATQQERDAFAKIVRLVKVRDRSVSEVRSRLVRDGFDLNAAEDAILRALSCGYLDDQRFADAYVRSRLRQGKGLAGIVRDLKSQEIDPDSLPGFPDVYLERVPSQEDAAYALLCRKPPRSKNLQQAAYAKLVRAGYPSAVASAATRRWFDNR